MPSDPVVTPEPVEPKTVERESDLAVEEASAPTAETDAEGEAAAADLGADGAGDGTAGEEPEAGDRSWRERAHGAIETPCERFHSTLVVTADQLRSWLAARRDTDSDRGVERVADELGPFASGRIDPKRFAELVSEAEGSDPASLEPMERALDALASLIERGDELHFVRVAAGGDLADAVGRALAEAGRAFGAARVFEAARRGAYDAGTHDAWLAAFPFALWSRAERELAPPLVVEVEGGDLQAAGLAEFLDGAQKLVLVVQGESPPAPLARLVSPGTFVLQTDHPDQLGRLSEVEGPAVGALVPEGACLFTHEPGREGAPGSLSVAYMPEEAPRRRLGSRSAFQQAEELGLLAALRRRRLAGPVRPTGWREPDRERPPPRRWPRVKPRAPPPRAMSVSIASRPGCSRRRTFPISEAGCHTRMTGG